MARILTNAGLVLLLLAAPLVVQAQTTISSRASSIRIGGRLHAQYQGSSVDGAINDFFLRRARVIVDGTFNDFFVGRLQTDFSGGSATVLDAYIRMDFSDAFRLSIGQMKRSFDLFELSSSTDLSIIERTGKITGVSSCTGVGSVCSLSRLTESLAFAGRDAGFAVDGSSGSFSYRATVTNGTGVAVPDENDGKSVSGRASVAATDNLTVSANLGFHDYLDPADETAYAVAWGGDLELGTWRDGLHVQAGVVGGDNWKSLDLAGEAGKFLSVQAVASFYHPLDGDKIEGIEPLARISVTDPDGSIDEDGGTLITPGLMLYFMGKNKIGANLDYYMPQTGDSEFGFRIGTFLYF